MDFTILAVVLLIGVGVPIRNKRIRKYWDKKNKKIIRINRNFSICTVGFSSIFLQMEGIQNPLLHRLPVELLDRLLIVIDLGLITVPQLFHGGDGIRLIIQQHQSVLLLKKHVDNSLDENGFLIRKIRP